jgi:hypothetical protein
MKENVKIKRDEVIIVEVNRLIKGMEKIIVKNKKRVIEKYVMRRVEGDSVK